MTGTLADNLREITQDIFVDYHQQRAIDKLNIRDQPSKEDVVELTEKLIRIMYPGYYKTGIYKVFSPQNSLAVLLEDVTINLKRLIMTAMKSYHPDEEIPQEKLCKAAEEITLDFLKMIVKIRSVIDTDVNAALAGDPAAENAAEIIVAYPGLFAITVYRLAHELYVLGVPLVPRIMSEYAHSRTGIDINPGAVIGTSFFIDHGTGIVIGETSVIGNNVKLYQGVTLGALSTRKGRDLRNKKRHPMIASSGTLSGVQSGKGSVIGGNVFITKSVAPYTRVSVKNQELCFDENKKIIQSEEEGFDESWFYTI